MSECEDVSRLIDSIYDAALDAEQWPQALERVTQFFGSSAAHLAIDNHASTHGRLISFGADPAYARSYADYYAARNVLWHRVVQQSISGVATNRMVMPMDELRRSEFYNDFLRPQGGDELLCSLCLLQADPTMSLIIGRPEHLGQWELKHLELLKLLTPHVRGALRANQHIGALRLAQDLAGEALYHLEHGVILVDAQALVLFANRAAEAILADGVLRIDRQRLIAQQTSDTSGLGRMINRAAEDRLGGSIVISRDKRPSLLINVLPIKAGVSFLTRNLGGAILFIKDLEHPAKSDVTDFANYFGLSPAQAALAHELVAGDGLIAAAKRLGVSHSTVRTHLGQIFQKTGTRRQAELVRLILEWTEGPAFVEKAPAAEHAAAAAYPCTRQLPINSLHLSAPGTADEAPGERR